MDLITSDRGKCDPCAPNGPDHLGLWALRYSWREKVVVRQKQEVLPCAVLAPGGVPTFNSAAL